MEKPPLTRDVPIPESYRKNHRYPFADMKVGDSFEAMGLSANRLNSAAQYWKRKLGHEYTIRANKTGCRVWRVK